MKSDLHIFLLVTIPIALLAGGGYFGWKKYEDMELSSLIAAKRAVVTRDLKDPASAQFRNEILRPSGWLCGELNSKNGYGAYVGYKRFLVRDSSRAHLEGYPPIGMEPTPDADTRIAEINSQIQFLRDHGRDRTSEEVYEEQFKSSWGKYCT